jgi:hypothetical protein
MNSLFLKPDLRDRGSENMLDINIEQYLKHFKVYQQDTLFPPDWDLLLKYRCPLCGNKLKFPVSGFIAFCNGKKHKKTFVINKDRLEYVVSKYGTKIICGVL